MEVCDFDDDAPVETVVDHEADDLPPLISLHAVAGIRTEDTMQIRVSVGNHELIALLDSGSTHNFVSAAAASCIGPKFQDSKGAKVVVVIGDRVVCCGLARDVAVRIGEEYFLVDCYTIPLDCYDMVLGVSFLRTLGPILWDFNDLCMAFWHHGRRVFWKGIGSTRTDIQPIGCLHSISPSGPALLERLLQEFEGVFAPPTGLPPARECDHRIHLLPNTAPVAVQPYRYP